MYRSELEPNIMHLCCSFRLCYTQKFIFSVITVILLSLPAWTWAHPHAWIDLRVTVMANEAGELTGLYQEWLFDPYYSQIVLEDVGSEVKGANEEAWLAAIAARILENLADYRYFTTLELEGEPIVDISPGASVMTAEQDRLRLSFEVLLDKPRSLAASRFSYAIADPTFYIEMLHEESKDAIRTDALAPACQIKIQPPNPSLAQMAQAAALGMNETGDPDLGRHFAEWVHMQCE
ncbi:DUF1007 family protein [Rhabdochromatium marinum]|uniref:DUF1007 family protein n=1 Tax=Rhabdochromatium marinum TaxID=48729 RepID=UPI001908A21F|nr:DUF1007 family protein [Rhabdochromatium marinum]MBK1647188.1 hypothetical protein [Rhabdochromatium marinum]